MTQLERIVLSSHDCVPEQEDTPPERNRAEPPTTMVGTHPYQSSPPAPRVNNPYECTHITRRMHSREFRPSPRSFQPVPTLDGEEDSSQSQKRLWDLSAAGGLDIVLYPLLQQLPTRTHTTSGMTHTVPTGPCHRLPRTTGDPRRGNPRAPEAARFGARKARSHQRKGESVSLALFSPKPKMIRFWKIHPCRSLKDGLR